MAECLLKLGADVDCCDEHGRTPLHVAAWQGEVNTCQLLLRLIFIILILC